MTAYNIDRKTASKLLNVSLRTVDRYLKQEKLSSIKSHGRIWLSKDEIINMSGGQSQKKRRQYRRNESLHVEPDIIADKDDNLSSFERASRGFARPEIKFSSQKSANNLIEELRKEIGIKDKRLTQASYKIGQLETQIAAMVPQLELQKQQKLLVAQNEIFEKRIREKEQLLKTTQEEYQQDMIIKAQEIKEIASLHKEIIAEKDTALSRIDRDLHLEKVNKWIYAVILYILVIGLVIVLVVSHGI